MHEGKVCKCLCSISYNEQDMTRWGKMCSVKSPLCVSQLLLSASFMHSAETVFSHTGLN